jgi:hypothetical protein
MRFLLLQIPPANPNAIPLPPGVNGLPTLEGLSNQTSAGISQLTTAAWDRSWQLAMSGLLYGIMARLGLTIAGIVVVFFVLQFAKNMIDDSSNRALTELIWPIIVVVLLINNGQHLSSLTLGMRNYINTVNGSILTTTTAGLDTQKLLDQIAIYQSKTAELGALQKQCDDKRTNEEMEACLLRVKQDAQKVVSSISAQDVAGAWGERLQQYATAIAQNPLKAGQDTLMAAMGMYLRSKSVPLLVGLQAILMASQAAFQGLVEASLLLTGLMGPIALGASLLPFGAKPIYGWLTAFWSVGLCKLCLNIITALMATTLYNIGPTEMLPASIMLGLLAPIMAFGMAAGGGMAIFTGITSAATTAVQVITLSFIKLK